MVVNGPSDDVGDWLVLGTAHFSLVLLAAAICVRLSRQCRKDRFAAWRWTWKLTRWNICSSDLQATVKTDLRSKVEEMIEERQRDFCRRVILLGCPGITLALIVIMGIKHIDWGYDQNSATLSLKQGHVMILCLTVVVFAGCLAFEGQPGHPFRVIVNIAGMARMTATVLMYQTSEQQLFDRYNLAVARICVCLVIGGGIKLNVALNVMLSCCQVASWLSFMLDGEQLEDKYGPYSVPWFAVHELLLTLTLCAIAIASEKRLQAEAHMSIQSKADRTLEKAMRRLLTMTYDVVTQVGEQFIIQQDTPELSAFLMRGADRSAKGDDLMDYLYSDSDREKFNELIRNDATQDTSAGVPIHVNLRDSSGAPVAAEIFHSRFLDMDDKTQHLVGIREKGGEMMQQQSDSLEANHDNGKSIRLKTRKRSAWHGTPARVEASHDSDLEHCDTRSENSADSMSQGSRLVCPEFHESSVHARFMSLASLMFSWNVRARRVKCCEFHELAKDALGLVKHMGSLQCLDEGASQMLRKRYSQQCHDCSILLLDEATDCHACATMDALAHHKRGSPGADPSDSRPSAKTTL
eukprot:TRINITY_DN5163_c0_g1_i3.p1 TRINITY_DN5163_c0_g1~~TRINITY_DN5163_c0_g1_i3.p1  ORF type:complete len:579 (-),score=67.42 TRINITY_DN5163_c0_g1_i3:200-1936(-)